MFMLCSRLNRPIRPWDEGAAVSQVGWPMAGSVIPGDAGFPRQFSLVAVARASRRAAMAILPMEAFMPANTAKSSAMPSLIPPDVQVLFGDPPRMRGEDVAVYNKLTDQFTKLVEPTDMIEWWWVKSGGRA